MVRISYREALHLLYTYLILLNKISVKLLRKRMTKYQDEIRLFIIGSLALLSLKTFFDLFYILIFIENKFYVSNGFIPLILILALGQIYGIIKEKKYTWLLSAFQLALIYFTSEATFGWLFSYVFKPFSLFHMSYAYFISTCLFASEAFKTFWLYKKLN